MTSASEWRIEERTVPSWEMGTVDRRWEVRYAATGAMRLVVLTKRSPGRFGGPAQYFCSCRLSSLLHPCTHVLAVIATLPPSVA